MRKTSFGYGRKTDLDYGKHRHNKSPSPDRYKIDTFVDFNKTHQRGSSCHIGRDVSVYLSQKTAPRGHIDLDPLKVPGPGRYDEFRYNESPKWTMRPITKSDLFQKTTIRINPGPGAHEFSEVLNPKGKYYCTKYKSSGSKVWNPKSSERFYKSTTDAPGAGNYNPQHNDLSDSGKYVLSKYQGDGKRRFAHAFRDSFVDQPSKETKSKNFIMQLLDLEHIVDHLILGITMKYIINQVKAFISKPNDTPFKVFFSHSIFMVRKDFPFILCQIIQIII